MENINDASEFYRGKKCIWMDADIVAYKLCDKNYDCERCSFDFVMRNTWKEKANSDKAQLNFANNGLIDKIIRKISLIRYDQELTHIKNQIVLKHMFGNIYTIGLSPLLSLLIENMDKAYFPKDYGLINKDEVILKVEGKWGQREIISPMKFTLLQKMNIDPDDFPEDSWFGVISVNMNELADAKLSFETCGRNRYLILNILSRYLKTEPEIGYTMMDGGKDCRYLYEAVGEKEFQKIISEL
ncbi:MAG TPA: hypothetical protein VKA26_10825 [Ignavibacteriaceae bacterium]|nr:hypothetical protein [Ignavibacteriaceae bacterium]